MKRKNIGIAASMAIIAGLMSFGSAAAGTPVSERRFVDDDNVECPNAAYSSIQAAIDESNPGDFVIVCDGVYSENVTIATSDLVVKSRSYRAAAIEAAAPGAIVTITGGVSGVVLKDFIIRGPFEVAGCADEMYGIDVQGGASAELRRNRITAIWASDPNLRGCQQGLAIVVGGAGSPITGNALIADNLIEHFQKNGITVFDEGSFIDVRRNFVVGEGPIDYTAQNGIQVSFGGGASVTDNVVQDMTYAPGDFSASGILAFDPERGNVDILRNRVLRSDDNIVLFGTRRALIADNIIKRSTLFDGIYVFDSVSNRLMDNLLRNNALFDCEDTTEGNRTEGTANFWTGNNGQTDSPPGICGGEGGEEPTTKARMLAKQRTPSVADRR